MNSLPAASSQIPEPEIALRQEPRFWQSEGWTAKVIKNEDDDGWAVAMHKGGEAEPALTGPWTMGRDKKNPKPLDINAFHTLVKTASEFVRRHEQQLQATLHQEITVSARWHAAAATEARYTVALDIEPDEDNPHASLSAFAGESQNSEPLACVKVAPSYRLSRASAIAWIENGCQRPAGLD